METKRSLSKGKVREMKRRHGLEIERERESKGIFGGMSKRKKMNIMRLQKDKLASIN